MGHSILVVDDQPGVRNLIKCILTSAGYSTVQEAEDGVAAYELIKARKPEPRLVLTDLQMPRMSGNELTERLSAEYPSIKIVCMSGHGDAPKGHPLLTKPFTSGDLLTMLDQVLEASASASA